MRDSMPANVNNYVIAKNPIFFKGLKVVLALLYIVVKHAKIIQSQSWIELFN